jgi:hypothetical protein
MLPGDFANRTFVQRANFIDAHYKQLARLDNSSIYPQQFFVYHCRSGYKPAWPEEIAEDVFPTLSVFDMDGKYYGVKSLKVNFFVFAKFLGHFERRNINFTILLLYMCK